MKTSSSDSASIQIRNSKFENHVRLFTDPSILHTIGFVRVAKLLTTFNSDLARANLVIPPEPDYDNPPVNGEYYDAVASLLASNSLPEPLLSTLATIERAAAPENADARETIIQRRLPCISLNRACPLDCALEFFFACPEELVRFRNEESFSSSSSSSSNPAAGAPADSSPADSSETHSGIKDQDQNSPREPVTGSASQSSSKHPESDPCSSASIGASEQQPIEIQKSKTEDPSSPPSTLQLPPGWIMQVDPWPEPVSAAALLDSLRVLFTQSVILPKWAPELLPLYVLHTYAYHLRDISVYLGIESPIKRCGKTTLLSLLLRLINRPVVAANVSSASFFHVIQDLKPTLMIDEADRFLKSRPELQGILNAGYTPDTAYVIRMGPPAPGSKAQSAVNFFSVWCPKVIAQIGHLPDTLADRCIVFRMQRKIPTEECQRIRSLNTLDLRRQCARFALDHAQAITTAKTEIPSALNDRHADIWEPLLVLADLAGGPWPKLARDAALGLAGNSEESNPIGSLLLDIFVAFTLQKAQRLFTRDLLENLKRRSSGRPWMEVRNGKEINEIWLARQLRPFGIRPLTLWIGDTLAKGYRLDQFGDAFKRYISKADLDAFAAECGRDPSAPSEPGQPPDDADAGDEPDPSS